MKAKINGVDVDLTNVYKPEDTIVKSDVFPNTFTTKGQNEEDKKISESTVDKMHFLQMEVNKKMDKYQKEAIEEVQVKDKYFTPEISDIRVGYECEKYSGYASHTDKFKVGTIVEKEDYWNNYIFDEYEAKDWDYDGGSGFLNFIYEIEQKRIRTPYLTKEAIEAEGWKQVKWSNSEILTFTKDKYWHCWYTLDGNVLSVDKGTRPLLIHQYFRGSCPSINEFRYIMKLLGI